MQLQPALQPTVLMHPGIDFNAFLVFDKVRYSMSPFQPDKKGLMKPSFQAEVMFKTT